MKKKQSKPRHCDWCGTRLRGRATCPRGPACAQEKAWHEADMERVKEADRGKR